MIPLSVQRPRLLVASAIALLAALFATVPDNAGAHGDGTEIFRQVDGPFVIAVRILPLQPLVGQLHLTITVDLLETGEPVEDARIRVTGRIQEGGATPLFSPALNIPTERKYYDANFDIEDDGIWNFEVEVSSDAGEGTVLTPVSIARRVRGESLGVAGTLMFVLVTGALVGGGSWIAYTARQKQRIRRERAANAREIQA
ncbi:MAG: hypothetical protein O3C10_03185 [Chloroflexi bacterium]|nr:hypothetical protein [Chloroflexota bacterium]